MGRNSNRFIIFITLHIEKTGKIGILCLFLIPGWKNENDRRGFPNFSKKNSILKRGVRTVHCGLTPPTQGEPAPLLTCVVHAGSEAQEDSERLDLLGLVEERHNAKTVFVK